MLFGKFVLMDYAGTELRRRYPSAGAFALVADQLAGVERMARAVLPMGSAEDVLAAPASALASQGGDHVYTVAGSSEVRRVPVQVIERGALQVVFKSPEPLEKVVDYPAADLADGAKVTVR